MSDYGMIVAGESGQIQIDSLFRNFTLWRQGYCSYNSGASMSEQYPWYADPQVPGTPVIFTYRPVSTAYLSIWIDDLCPWFSGSPDYTASVGPLLMYNDYSIGPWNKYFYYAAFKLAGTSTLPTYGMVVYTPDGDIAFSSDEKYMKVVSVTTGSGGYSGVDSLLANRLGDYTDHTVEDADNNYFLLTPNSRYMQYRVIYDGGGNPLWVGELVLRSMRKIDSTTIRVQSYCWAFWPYGEISNIWGTHDWWTTNYKLIEIEI